MKHLAHDELKASVASWLSMQCKQERFFVLKAHAREVMVYSETRGYWATRAHSSCDDEEQPHQRLKAARCNGACRVVLLFAQSMTSEWVGHAVMTSDPYFVEGENFPYCFDVSWKVHLPHGQGISFASINTNEAHKIFNGDEILYEVGSSIREALDAKMALMRRREEEALQAVRNSAFFLALPSESDLEARQRLLSQTERRLGPVIVACLCGSRRYNLHFPESDFDMLVVYSSNSDDTPDMIRNASGCQPDYTLMEVGRFVQMLLKGDPQAVESLFFGRWK